MVIKGTSLYGLGNKNLSNEEVLKSRNCYCDVTWTSPKFQEERDKLLAEGAKENEACGFCEDCGKPGHICHYPGPFPYTGCWCDEHYVTEFREQKIRKKFREAQMKRFEEESKKKEDDKDSAV